MDKNLLPLLLRKYMDNTISEEERVVLFNLILSDRDAELEQAVQDNFSDEDILLQEDLRLRDLIYRKLRGRIMPAGKTARTLFRTPKSAFRMAVAAGLLLLISVCGYIFLYTAFFPPAAEQDISRSGTDDVRPGGNKAVLYLSSGKSVILDSLPNGSLAAQGSINAIKQNNLLTYHSSKGKNVPDLPVQYNTLRTPRGGQYRLELPDGTQVWLNAASSINFPTVFADKERKVTITGEVYFEVAKKSGKPFLVNIRSSGGNDEGTVKVYGTHFNINAYDDEASVKTTLLEGSVELQHLGQKVLLIPGQEASLNKSSGSIKVQKADPEEAVAWKNGEFLFNNTSIYAITRQLSRWYDVDVRYRDSVVVFLNGSISRNVNATKVFKILELTREVHFDIKDHTIWVSGPKQ